MRYLANMTTEMIETLTCLDSSCVPFRLLVDSVGDEHTLISGIEGVV